MIFCEKILEFFKIMRKKKYLMNLFLAPGKSGNLPYYCLVFVRTMYIDLIEFNNESLLNTHMLYRGSIVSNKNIKIYNKVIIPYPKLLLRPNTQVELSTLIDKMF